MPNPSHGKPENTLIDLHLLSTACFLLSSELQNGLSHMSELAVDLYVPQTVQVSTDQGGTLREARGKDNSDTA